MFTYKTAFSRNIGCPIRQRQQQLRQKWGVIAGLGGVGEVHLLTLCRRGIGKFYLADFKRQAGATFIPMNLGKLEIIIRQARGINPGRDIKIFPGSVDLSNLSVFFTDVALCVDGLDFLAFEARRIALTTCIWRPDGNCNPLQQFVLAAGATSTRCHDAPKFIRNM